MGKEYRCLWFNDMSKQLFGKYRAAQLQSSPPPKFKLTGITAPHQPSGLAGIKPKKKNNPLKAALTALPATKP